MNFNLVQKRVQDTEGRGQNMEDFIKPFLQRAHSIIGRD